MNVRAIRGAITLDSDSAEEVKHRTLELLREIISRNELDTDDLISIFMTATDDIKSVAPAAAIRDYGLTDLPLLCAQEMAVDSSLPLCVRLMLHLNSVRTRSEIEHVFLRKAAALRPDLSKSGDGAE
jgi:chorismate mutase